MIQISPAGEVLVNLGECQPKAERPAPTLLVCAHYGGAVHPRVRGLVESLGGGFADTGPDDFGYFRLLQRLWRAQETFIVIERDVLPTEAALSDLAWCRHEWCGCPYDSTFATGQRWYDGRWRTVAMPTMGLGCAKFEGSLMRRYPSLVDDLWAEPDMPLLGQPHLYPLLPGGPPEGPKWVCGKRIPRTVPAVHWARLADSLAALLGRRLRREGRPPLQHSHVTHPASHLHDYRFIDLELADGSVIPWPERW